MKDGRVLKYQTKKRLKKKDANYQKAMKEIERLKRLFSKPFVAVGAEDGELVVCEVLPYPWSCVSVQSASKRKRWVSIMSFLDDFEEMGAF